MMTQGEIQGPKAGEPGAWLAAAREQVGWSLVQAADQLHLDVTAVKAIEAGDFASLGAAVYARGHLRRYAALLGLPVQEVEKAFLQANPARSAPDLRHGAGLLQKSDAAAGAIRPGVAAIGAVLLVIVGIVLWAKRVPHGAAPAPAEARAAAASPAPAKRAPQIAAPAQATADAQAVAQATPAEGGLLNAPEPTRMLAGAATESAAQFNGQSAALWDATADSAALRSPMDGGGGVIDAPRLHAADAPAKSQARAHGAQP
jgi:cytoskeleton protein RodZ